MKNKGLALVVIAAAAACGPKTTYKVATWSPPASGSTHSAGLVYVLPKTALVVEVDVETTTRVKGAYAKYNAALGFEPVDAAKPDAESKITAVRVTPTTVPDPTRRFVIIPEHQGRLVERGTAFQFTETGGLSGADSTMRNRSTDVVTSTLGATASIVGSAFGFSGVGAVTKAAGGERFFSIASSPPSNDSKKNADECITAVATVINGGSTPQEVHKAQAAPPCNAAARLTVLTQKRDLLISEAKPQMTVETYNAVLGAITKEIDDLRQLFFVKEKKEVRVWRHTLDPESNEKCLSFAADTGVVGNWKACPAAPVASDLQIEVEGSIGTCDATPDGVVYRVPVSAPFSAHQGGKQLAAGRAAFPQFGDCAVAPREVYGKEAKLIVKLSENTGMLIGFTSEESKDYSEAIAKSGEAVEGVLNEAKSAQERRHTFAEEARKKAEADRDPVSAKKRELELLELQRQIECYGTIGGPCKEPAKVAAEK